jgi:hypothetical protein
MRTLLAVAAIWLSVLAVLGASTAQAEGIAPGWYAQYQLSFGNAPQRYAAGCLRWNWQQNAWYTVCGPALPAAAVVRVRY